MVNQMAMDTGVSLGQLKNIEDLIPDMAQGIAEKVEAFLDKSGEIGRAHV